ncbi:hypothetical protein Ade02nite_02720 [Paractinoplanes deccanensis]|uniref:Uncharacterized protein n=1 Tax=Paractinoplanes deccanensis TaxID=113561 RepID=A0ABQ3XV74_9ACTN|nr:hypothetical protein [Actinoplanes deccanensis]GID71631.1 hypothetical protein Ade02nite_02720 [Actinoplanes deccanensis]
MTAPGDSVLLLALLAVFFACCGYAAGRAHQKRLTAHERAAAYRSGYETASERVFSLAARTVAAGRPARGSASAHAGTAPSSPGTPSSRAARGPASAHAGTAPSSPGTPSSPPAADVSGASEVAGAPVSPAARPRPGGFPAPPPPPRHVQAEPAAVGGVMYQPFPDPRPADGSPPELRPAAPGDGLPAGRHTVPDELVQAKTYQLPPDRVFRAKVAGKALPEEPTTSLPVPKPRRP